MFEEQIFRKAPENVQERLEFSELLSLIRENSIEEKKELLKFLELQVSESERLLKESNSVAGKKEFTRKLDYFNKMLNIAERHIR